MIRTLYGVVSDKELKVGMKAVAEIELEDKKRNLKQDLSRLRQKYPQLGHTEVKDVRAINPLDVL